ncbi:interferon beta [Alexandromys fortis]|uniref:interferon beta n=1 Tax=Alexandromys fortis TaxID=100897 RepID=UPI0021521A4B|nr:interferon beta [Microtus fortis]
MTNRWILQAAFLLGFLSIALSINYEDLGLRQSSTNSACLELLEQLDGQLCLGHRINFKIPMDVKRLGQAEKKDAVIFIREMLQNIFIVFKNNSSSTGWKENIVESFLGKLYDQIDFLNKVLEEVPANERWTPSNFPTSLRLKSYYRRMQSFLEVKGYSSCAWMVVRAEILRNFSIIRRLTNTFQI